MKKTELESMHLAELHALAADAGLDRYRMLRREELVERLVGDGDDDDGRPEGRRSRRARPAKSRDRSRDEKSRDGNGRRRRRGEDARDRGSRSESEDASGAEEASETSIVGPLEILTGGEALIHGENGEQVLVSAAQVRRCELRAGDLVEGPVRSGRRGERRPGLLRVEKVNGAEPVEGRGPAFEQLTAVTPTRPIPLKIDADDVLTRTVDLLSPLAFGHRLLVRAEPVSGRTTLLRGLARAVLAAENPPEVIVLLVDERPEEVTEWRKIEGAEIVDAGADMRASDQLRRAEMALATAKRRAEAGQDVVLLIDSLTRIAVAADDASAAKPFFGAGRDLAEPEAGSLTVIAVALRGSSDGEAVERAVATTESSSIELSAELTAEGTFPAVTGIRPSVGGEELLREGDVLAAARRLRAELSLLPAAEASKLLADRIAASKSNEELLS